METKMTIVAPHIRWMIRADMEATLAIENDSFEFPWSEEDFVQVLRSRNVIGMVCEQREKVIGYVIYELFKTKLEIINMAVAWSHRNKKVGTAIIEKLKGKLSIERRTKIIVDVRERNLDAQLFFKAMEFKAIKLVPDVYDDIDESTIRFQYRITK